MGSNKPRWPTPEKYVVVSLKLDIEVLKVVCSFAKSFGLHPVQQEFQLEHIFLRLQPEVEMDPHRLQSKVQDPDMNPALKLIQMSVMQMSRCVQKYWIPTKCVILVSLANGKDQAVHYDDPRSKLGPGEYPMGSAIISIMPGTKMNMVDQQGTLKVVDIPVGYVCIFDGHKLHSGSSYKRLNRKIHFHLVNKKQKVKVPDNQIVKLHKCAWCERGFSNINTYRWHKRYSCQMMPECESSSKMKEKQQKRLRNQALYKRNKEKRLGAIKEAEEEK